MVRLSAIYALAVVTLAPASRPSLVPRRRRLLMSVPKAGPVRHGLVVRLVLHGMIGKGREVWQNLFDRLPEPLYGFFIIGILIPNAENILRVSNGNDQATDFAIGHSKLATDKGQQDFFPVPTGQTFGESDDPFPALGIGLVFPGRFDTGSKEMVVGRGG